MIQNRPKAAAVRFPTGESLARRDELMAELEELGIAYYLSVFGTVCVSENIEEDLIFLQLKYSDLLKTTDNALFEVQVGNRAARPFFGKINVMFGVEWRAKEMDGE